MTLRLVDVSNFWSPTGGGVRRYQLEKLRALAGRSDVHYVLVIPSDERRTEEHEKARIEHVPSSRLPGSGGYRQILGRSGLREVIRRHDPDVIECGSPWIMPHLVRGLSDRAAVVGFWHADFPRAHFGRGARSLHARLGPPAEEVGWAWARASYGAFDAVLCASERVSENLVRHGLRRILLTPLGVHSEIFHPGRRDPALARRFRAGDDRRRVFVFAHRLNEEKGLSVVLKAHALVSRELEPSPALVFAGVGPGRARVERHARRHPHVHLLGYLADPTEVARVLASSDIALSLSAYETFGLSTAEAMACGVPVIAADEGSAAELVERSGGGITVPREADALAEAMRSLARGRPEVVGASGRVLVERTTWPVAVERLLRAYREVASAKAAGRQLAPGVHRLDVASPGAAEPAANEPPLLRPDEAQHRPGERPEPEDERRLADEHDQGRRLHGRLEEDGRDG